MAIKSKTTSTTSPRRRTPVVSAPGTGIDEAYSNAIAWWTTYEALEDLNLGATLEDVVTAARTLGLQTVQAMHRHAAQVIAHLTGETNITKFTSPSTAERIHVVRNAIAAITFAAEVLDGADPFGPYDLIAQMPGVAPRHGGKTRPATDDEILLTRSRAIHSVMRAGRYTKGASQYALAESGAHPIETTAIRPRDFNSTVSPTSVSVHGGTWYNRRDIELTPFARRVLAITIDAFFAARPGAHHAPLCSDCTTAGSASASATANLKRYATGVGIVTPALEGTYATRWRAHKELRDVGAIAALHLIGKNHPKGVEYDEPRRVYEFLNLPPRPVTIEIEPADDGEDLRNFG